LNAPRHLELRQKLARKGLDRSRRERQYQSNDRRPRVTDLGSKWGKGRSPTAQSKNNLGKKDRALGSALRTHPQVHRENGSRA